ncbi:hypothetical protein HYH03_000590 [Edaphochlamys debaryana]|uniref:mRNA capping enzyme adenylation domain-containing protein n=1 Tax=Edaphochlamys debaryana TaxID=47281 RepID=A0A835YG52_9CHLO|nr:hypothetical protein HYH03_000590 [Edaphochlamys debaryana]|eukprot:KAG2502098.1 hypothetical protein HYH03_000590 [Edaphochlamys debaryana]
MAAFSSGPAGGAVLLIGAPGVGKSTLGRLLAQQHEGRGARFVSVGDELRERGLALKQEELPWGARHRELRATAEELLRTELRAWAQLWRTGALASCYSPLLLLECVEETEDAFAAVELLAEAEVPLLQVLYLTHDITCRPGLKEDVMTASTQPTAAVRRWEQRKAIWEVHAPRVIEFFTALGVLTEVGVDGSLMARPSLATAGYARSYTFVGPGPWLPAKTASPPLQVPAELALTPLQHVTSIRLVTWRAERDEVLEAAARLSGLGLNTFFRGGGGGMGHAGPALPLPACSVRSPSDVQWLAVPGRYAVSRKADGTRCLLIVPGEEAAAGSGGGEAYLLNRVGSLYKHPVRTLRPCPEPEAAASGNDGGLPSGTVLDGELLWHGGRGFFLAFDALCVGGQQLWSRPLRERLAALRDMEHGPGLAEAEQCKDFHVPAAPKGQPASSKHALRKKQQAPLPVPSNEFMVYPRASSEVCVLRKRHFDVSAEALKSLEASRGSCPYPTDGLVFTPYDMPYVLGMAELTYTWQRPEQAVLDLRCAQDLRELGVQVTGGRAATPVLMPGTVVRAFRGPAKDAAIEALVYACRPVWDKAGLTPFDIRWDKTSAIVEGKRLQGSSRGGLLTASQLAAAVAASQRAAHIVRSEARSSTSAGPLPPPVHPARAMPYDDLYGSVMAAVEAGGVQRSMDPGSGLELFSCRTPGSPPSPAEALCRGLVLHPPSRTVVATPFTFAPSIRETADLPAKPSSDGPQPMTLHLPRLTATLLAETLEEAGVEACPSLPGYNVQPCVASVKVDGSPVLAFTWSGQLQTAGRERMDSEQALWAREWLHQHANLTAFRPGQTYVLEAVYGADTHVVPYAFEGVVLLGAYDETGRELPWTQLPALANELGVTMAAPSLRAPLPELLAALTLGGEVTAGKLAPPTVPPSFKGWVVVAPDGQRYKHVQVPYKQVSMARQSLHPLFVWDRVCYGGATPSSLATGLPLRFRRELDAILSALAEGYGRARGDLLGLLRHAEAEGRLADLRCPAGASSSNGTGAAAGSPDEIAKAAEAVTAALVVRLSIDCGGASRATQTSSARSPTLPSDVPPKLLRALAYALAALAVGTEPLQDSHVPPSMYYTGPPAEGSAVPAPSLRRLLLHCVQPSVDGTLPGYAPSGLMAQEWAKDWAQGPAGRMSPATPPPFLHTALLDELVQRCLAPLKGRDLVAGLSVCSKWCRLMSEAPRPYDLASRQAAGKLSEERSRGAARRRARQATEHRELMAWLDRLHALLQGFQRGLWGAFGPDLDYAGVTFVWKKAAPVPSSLAEWR